MLAITPEARLAEFAAPETVDIKMKKGITELIKEGEVKPFLSMGDNIESMMKSFVVKESNRKAFRKMLEIYLDEKSYAILHHCHGGKDRTGFGSALILGILGVPKAEIMRDYLLSNSYNAKK